MKKIFNKRSALYLGATVSGAACILAMPLAPTLSIVVFGGLSSYLLAQGFMHKKTKSNRKSVPNPG
ncbi:MAG: hypothetical protein ACSHX3_07850 [Litorimonas sp.]